MTTLDTKVTSLLDAPNTHNTEDSDEDALIASLENEENDPTFTHLREKRLHQLHAEFQRTKAHRNLGHGTYDTITHEPEKSILDITTSTAHCIVHFFRADFTRCRIMHSHLSALAERHLEARFVCVDVERVPFLVEKLKVRVLPCVIAFVGGKSVERIIGFEGVGKGGDGFRTQELEIRLVASGVLERVKMEKHEKPPGSESRRRVTQEEDEDYDEWE